MLGDEQSQSQSQAHRTEMEGEMIDMREQELRMQPACISTYAH